MEISQNFKNSGSILPRKLESNRSLGLWNWEWEKILSIFRLLKNVPFLCKQISENVKIDKNQGSNSNRNY